MKLAVPAFAHNKTNIFASLLFCLAVGGGVLCFPGFYLLHSNVLIGLLLFPFTVFITGPQRNNYVYLLCVLFCGALALLYNLRIAYFFMLAFFILWWVEFLTGKCNPLILFLLVFMSPVFTQVTTILGFPLRLHISSISGSVLQMTGLDVRVEGNMIVLHGSVFSVDEACMGLSMLAMSVLMAVFIMGYRYRTSGKQSGLFKLFIFFLIVFALNLLTNLFRIVILVLFNLPPENFLHELVGILCFACYTILPVYFISGWMTSGGREISRERPVRVPLSVMQKIASSVFAVAVVVTGMMVNVQKSRVSSGYADVSYPYGSTVELDDGITKIVSDQLLIYVKPIPEFFTGEHTPLMCWKGSGYVFSGVKEKIVDGKTIYTGKLTHQVEELYTAWWYSNGKIETISQFEWRSRMLRGEDKFCLVNITAKDEETLIANVASIFRSNSLAVQYR